MDLSAQLREYIVREWRIVSEGLAALEPSPENLPKAVYLFSAVFGATSRVLNISYERDLVLLHVITSYTHGAINARVNDILNGQNMAIGLPSQVFSRLAELITELADTVERDEDFTDVLARVAEVGHVTTGNGFYLYQTRGVGL